MATSQEILAGPPLRIESMATGSGSRVRARIYDAVALGYDGLSALVCLLRVGRQSGAMVDAIASWSDQVVSGRYAGPVENLVDSWPRRE